ncbi:gas vesicle protein GvpG [Streptomyces sp. NPDC057565]|uniref:gas vesicle protein GvpG n=1 Tax=Streptomyces sp. NPDC057565 TaxID=3346169 RepID=UPI003695D73C
MWTSERLVDAAAKELHDPSAIRAQLCALNRALDSGEIDEEQFEREEERLLDLLERRSSSAPPRNLKEEDHERKYKDRSGSGDRRRIRPREDA